MYDPVLNGAANVVVATPMLLVVTVDDPVRNRKVMDCPGNGALL